MKHIHRWAFVFIIVRFAVAACAGEKDFTEMRLNDRVLILQHAPWLETMTVVDAGPSLIVVDTWGSLSATKKAKAFIDSLFQKPVRLVINTHHHWDHKFGNQAFAGATIVGHCFCAEDMKADYTDAKKRKTYFNRSASNAQNESLRKYILSVGKESTDGAFRLFPSSRLSGERDTLRAGDLTILIYHTPSIHTRSNLTIFIPELGIVFGRREFSEPDKMKLEPGAEPAKIARVLEEVLASGKPVRYLISGHGDPIENPDLHIGLNSLLNNKKTLDN